MSVFVCVNLFLFGPGRSSSPVRMYPALPKRFRTCALWQFCSEEGCPSAAICQWGLAGRLPGPRRGLQFDAAALRGPQACSRQQVNLNGGAILRRLVEQSLHQFAGSSPANHLALSLLALSQAPPQAILDLYRVLCITTWLLGSFQGIIYPRAELANNP